jgi:hypothetical protein
VCLETLDSMPVTILHIQVAEKRASFPVLILIL